MTKQESSSILLREDRGPVAILTLNRPDKLNALSNELIAGIVNVLDNIEPDSSVRAVVITGAGRASVLERTSRHFRNTCKLDQQMPSRTSCALAIR